MRRRRRTTAGAVCGVLPWLSGRDRCDPYDLRRTAIRISHLPLRAADGSWDFEGDRNFRYWLFVSGKRVETLGLVAPTDKPVIFSFRGSDGNFPGWTVVQYESKAAPADVIGAYAKRCESLKAKVTERPASEPKEGVIAARIECEFTGYLTAEFFAERTSSSPVTEVGLRVWGHE